MNAEKMKGKMIKEVRPSQKVQAETTSPRLKKGNAGYSQRSGTGSLEAKKAKLVAVHCGKFIFKVKNNFLDPLLAHHLQCWRVHVYTQCI